LASCPVLAQSPAAQRGLTFNVPSWDSKTRWNNLLVDLAVNVTADIVDRWIAADEAERAEKAIDVTRAAEEVIKRAVIKDGSFSTI